MEKGVDRQVLSFLNHKSAANMQSTTSNNQALHRSLLQIRLTYQPGTGRNFGCFQPKTCPCPILTLSAQLTVPRALCASWGSALQNWPSFTRFGEKKIGQNGDGQSEMVTRLQNWLAFLVSTNVALPSNSTICWCYAQKLAQNGPKMLHFGQKQHTIPKPRLSYISCCVAQNPIQRACNTPATPQLL